MHLLAQGKQRCPKGYVKQNWPLGSEPAMLPRAASMQEPTETTTLHPSTYRRALRMETRTAQELTWHMGKF